VYPGPYLDSISFAFKYGPRSRPAYYAEARLILGGVDFYLGSPKHPWPYWEYVSPWER
jgi:hypothetical protein